MSKFGVFRIAAFQLVVGLIWFAPTRAAGAVPSSVTYMSFAYAPQKGSIPALTLAGVTVTGSANVWVGSLDLGIVGGFNDQSVDPGEFIEVTFNNGPVSYVNYSQGFFLNNDAKFIEAWGIGNVYLGSAYTDTSQPNYPTFSSGITGLFGGQAITRFRIKPVSPGGESIRYLFFPRDPVSGSNINPLVTFAPLSSTYRTLLDTSGCPAGSIGKFAFTARLGNKASSPSLSALGVRVKTLTNGNVLLNAQPKDFWLQAIMDLPKLGLYANGWLSPNESVDTPLVVCLKTNQPFQFLVDVFSATTKLASVNRAGMVGIGVWSPAVISADGRIVAFVSAAGDFVATDTKGFNDVFARDLQNGTTALVSVNSAGTDSGNARSVLDGAVYEPRLGLVAMSSEGRFIVFRSQASDLVTNDTNNFWDVFVRDLQLNTTTLVSINRNGTNGGNGNSFVGEGSMSANGITVAFSSAASDLVTNDNNGLNDVFVRDLQTNTTTLVSRNQSGTGSGNGNSGHDVISGDGHVLVFGSSASDLVPNDTNGKDDLFARDLQTGTTTLVSVNQAGTASGNGYSFGVKSINEDGRIVAFLSDASDLVPNDNNGHRDLFVRNLQTGTTTLVTVNRAGTGSGNEEPGGHVALSPDGRFIAFDSLASDLVANDTNGTMDVFVRDLHTGTTSLVSVNHAGTGTGNNYSGGRLSFSSDGRLLAFRSFASDLVPIDTNFTSDVFVRDLQTGKTSLISVNLLGLDSGEDFSMDPMITADGRFVAFTSYSIDLTPEDISQVDPNNRATNIFVRPVP